MNNNSEPTSPSYSIFKNWFNISNYLGTNPNQNKPNESVTSPPIIELSSPLTFYPFKNNLVETATSFQVMDTQFQVIETPFQVRDCRDNVIDVSNQVMTNTIIYQNTAKPIIDTTDLFTSYVQNDERERSSFFNELIKDLNYKYDKLSEKYEELKDQQNKNAQVIDELLAKVNKMNELLDKQSELFVQNMLHHTFSNNSLPSVQLLQYKTRQRPLSISIDNQY